MAVSYKREEEVKGQFGIDRGHSSVTRTGRSRHWYESHRVCDGDNATSSRQQGLMEIIIIKKTFLLFVAQLMSNTINNSI